ncbi:MAG: hypothetical protein ACOCYP_00525 [Planctomycetota bacterium]
MARKPDTVSLSYRRALHLHIAMTYVIFLVVYVVMVLALPTLPPLLGSHLVTWAVLSIVIFIPFIFLSETTALRVDPDTIQVERAILRAQVTTRAYTELLRVRLHPIKGCALDPRPPRTARHCVSIETDQDLVPVFAFYNRDKANRFAKLVASRLKLPLLRSAPAAMAESVADANTEPGADAAQAETDSSADRPDPAADTEAPAAPEPSAAEHRA